MSPHPFDDGNGRLARAIGELLLARADGSPQRFYSLSAQIQRERSHYYQILEATQKAGWISPPGCCGFCRPAPRHPTRAHHLTPYWPRRTFLATFCQHAIQPLTNHTLNRLLDGFDGKLTTRRWASMANCSPDTELRDINQLVAWGVAAAPKGGGRSVG